MGIDGDGLGLCGEDQLLNQMGVILRSDDRTIIAEAKRTMGRHK